MSIIENTYKWENLTEEQEKLIVVCHAEGFRKSGANVSLEGLQRLFNLGKPKIVVGTKEGQIKYSRVHKDSVDVMKIITKNYLEEIIKSR